MSSTHSSSQCSTVMIANGLEWLETIFVSLHPTAGLGCSRGRTRRTTRLCCRATFQRDRATGFLTTSKRRSWHSNDFAFQQDQSCLVIKSCTVNGKAPFPAGPWYFSCLFVSRDQLSQASRIDSLTARLFLPRPQQARIPSQSHYPSSSRTCHCPSKVALGHITSRERG